MDNPKYTKDNLPNKIKLLNKVEIFPSGYELKKRGNVAYFKNVGSVHGISAERALKALNNGNAKAI